MEEEFQEIYDELELLRESSSRASEVIQDVKDLKQRVLTKIRELQRLLEQLKTGDKNKGIAVKREGEDQITDEMKFECNEILWSEIEEAVLINDEFNDDFFLSRLRRAAFDPDTIKITLFGGGNIFVKINLNETAGSLRDYAKGISRARTELGIADFHEMTNHFWQEKLYGPARLGTMIPARKPKEGSTRKVKSSEERTAEAIEKYWNTMRLRMERSGRIAPFWQILDQGTIPLASDREGTAYPSNRPTNFVTKAELKIDEYISANIHGTTEDVEQTEINIANIETLINSYLDIFSQIDDLLEELKDATVIDRTIERIMNYEERADPEKLEIIIRAVKAGNLSRISLTAEGRVEVTAPGGIRSRIGLKLISRILAEEMEQ